MSSRIGIRPLGVLWLALGVPVGALLGWLLQISDTAQDRDYGRFLLALALASMLVGLACIWRPGSRLWLVSLGVSGLWALAAGLAVILADFPADQMWGGGLTGLVALVTATVALRSASTARQRRS